MDQLMVNGADAATVYGVVVFWFSCTMYEPGSTLGGPDPSMSPGVSASCDVENETVTCFDCPASSVTRVKPTSRWGGTTTLLIGWATYTGTMSVPLRVPVFVTVNFVVTVPFRGTLAVAVRPVVVNAV